MKQRALFADFARVAATLAVIFVHSSGELIVNYGSVPDGYWLTAIFFNSIMRWCVCVFIMISGYFLLQPTDESIPMFIKKRFTRVLIPFLVWAFIYTIYNFREELFRLHFIPWQKIAHATLIGEIYYHLWFVSMIVGLYILTPWLRVFTKHASKKDFEYFLITWFILDTLVLFCKECIVVKYLGWMAYVGIYVLGFYLSKYNLPKKCLWPMLLIGIAITFFGTWWMSAVNGYFYQKFFIYLSPNLLVCSVAVFELLKQKDWSKVEKKSPRLIKFVLKISSLSFGIYLIHALTLDALKNGYLGVVIYNHTLFGAEVNPIIAVPVTVVFVFVISFVVLMVVEKLKPLKKFLM